MVLYEKEKIKKFTVYNFITIAAILIFIGTLRLFDFSFQLLGSPDYKESYVLRGSINLISFIPLDKNQGDPPEGQIFIMDPVASISRYFKDSFQSKATKIYFDSRARQANDSGLVWKINQEFRSLPARFGGRYEAADINVVGDQLIIFWAYRMVPEMKTAQYSASAFASALFLYWTLGLVARSKKPD